MARVSWEKVRPAPVSSLNALITKHTPPIQIDLTKHTPPIQIDLTKHTPKPIQIDLTESRKKCKISDATKDTSIKIDLTNDTSIKIDLTNDTPIRRPFSPCTKRLNDDSESGCSPRDCKRRRYDRFGIERLDDDDSDDGNSDNDSESGGPPRDWQRRCYCARYGLDACESPVCPANIRGLGVSQDTADKAEIAALKAEIAALKAQNSKLEAHLAGLNAGLKAAFDTFASN